MVALNHRFCRLLSTHMILWSEIAICHSKSDPRVTEEWQETLVFSVFCLDGAIGLSWEMVTSDAQELSYEPVMHNIKILRVVPLRFVWTTKWKWMRVVVGSWRTPKSSARHHYVRIANTTTDWFTPLMSEKLLIMTNEMSFNHLVNCKVHQRPE